MKESQLEEEDNHIVILEVKGVKHYKIINV